MTIEINEGRGVGEDRDHILLQLSHLPPEILAERLPGISETASIFAGVDVTKEPVPVIPTVHYNMGGIPTNYKGQVVNPTEDNPHHVVEGLWAAGEAACSSVHGANRLGANSLLDIVVFGRACAEHISDLNQPGDNIHAYDSVALTQDINRFTQLRMQEGDQSVGRVRNQMQKLMQKHAGVFRTESSLQEGVDKLLELYTSSSNISISDKTDVFNTELVELLELHNLLDNSLATMYSANFRKESRGAHSLQEYPERDDVNWLVHTLAYLRGDGITLDTREVIQYTLDKDLEPVPLAKRVY
jgi:succinate dehydrogenase (ubiquinone) flavoprotein subunit